MEKKAIILLFLISFVSFAAANSIKINDVFLGEQIKIDANYENMGLDTNTLCQFMFYETATGNLADRATDEYSIDTNHVYSVDYTINEPPLFRDQNYTLKVICAGIEKSTTFTVGNRRSFGFGIQKETEYLLKSGNLDIIAILIFIIIIFSVFFLIIWWFYKMKVKL